jgi:hypothetical protein
LAPGLDVVALGELYFNARRRMVSATPRNVKVASGFSCPAPHQAALTAIQALASTGGDLLPHLSRSLKKGDYDDALLNDWGIHHLHLSTNKDPDGFVSRTKELLFARSTDDAMYCIAVLPHGAWSNQAFVQALHDNWPATLS